MTTPLDPPTIENGGLSDLVHRPPMHEEPEALTSQNTKAPDPDLNLLEVAAEQIARQIRYLDRGAECGKNAIDLLRFGTGQYRDLKDLIHAALPAMEIGIGMLEAWEKGAGTETADFIRHQERNLSTAYLSIDNARQFIISQRES